MKIKFILCLILLVLSFASIAKPKISLKYQRNAKNLAEIQVINQTTEALLCYVAIDGHKIKFKLRSRQSSKWYRATDPSFNHQSFSTWCDYLSLHPQFQKN